MTHLLGAPRGIPQTSPSRPPSPTNGNLPSTNGTRLNSRHHTKKKCFSGKKMEPWIATTTIMNIRELYKTEKHAKQAFEEARIQKRCFDVMQRSKTNKNDALMCWQQTWGHLGKSPPKGQGAQEMQSLPPSGGEEKLRPRSSPASTAPCPPRGGGEVKTRPKRGSTKSVSPFSHEERSGFATRHQK